MSSPMVAIVMGSKSDLPVMQEAIDILTSFGVPWEARVCSAHRNPDGMIAWARDAEERGIRFFIAGAGMAAHLPGMVAAVTTVPVLGVPILSSALAGADALYSIVQMPRGVPVATFAIGGSGATNAAVYAVQVLATTDADLKAKLLAYRAGRAEKGTIDLGSG